MTNRLARSLTVVLALSLPLAVVSRDARACGGFFCQNVPVDQSGEQIIFSLEPGKVTTTIQIAYTGAASDFSWVVPVLSVPKISVGHQAVFRELDLRTRPQFRIDLDPVDGMCADFRAVDDAVGSPQAGNESGVTILAQGEVGPFNYVVVQSPDATELNMWLAKNGFQQPPEAQKLIAYYLNQGMLFVAVKLKKDAMVGEIQPLVLEMTSPDAEACIPLILTQIAAVKDMPVLGYVLASARAFPRNWFHVEPDLAKVNWFTGGDNYRAVASEAINDAAGHGFITEYAGKAVLMKDAVFSAGMFNLSLLRAATTPAAFMNQIRAQFSTQSLRGDPTVLALLRKHIPMPASLAAMGVTERDFYNNLETYQAQLTGPFDPIAFAMDLEERIIKPLESAQKMIDAQPYLTRLLSTVSPDEMTRDPLFLLNASLPDVSNLHVAKAYGQCQANNTIANFKLELDDGQKLDFTGSIRPYDGSTPWPFASKVPAARRISLVGPTGPPVYITKAQVPAIDKMLDEMQAADVRGRVIPVPGADKSSMPETLPKAGGGGCAIGGRGQAFPGGLIVGVLGFGLALIRRRARCLRR